MEVLNELNLTADLEHVTDMKKIASYGIMRSPTLLVNGKVVSVVRSRVKTDSRLD
ncbi:MAG: thioredoxin family protein [Thermodesulfobacteriota bacterium]|jgi:hypothetical protein